MSKLLNKITLATCLFVGLGNFAMAQKFNEKNFDKTALKELDNQYNRIGLSRAAIVDPFSSGCSLTKDASALVKYSWLNADSTSNFEILVAFKDKDSDEHGKNDILEENEQLGVVYSVKQNDWKIEGFTFRSKSKVDGIIEYDKKGEWASKAIKDFRINQLDLDLNNYKAQLNLGRPVFPKQMMIGRFSNGVMEPEYFDYLGLIVAEFKKDPQFLEKVSQSTETENKKNYEIRKRIERNSQKPNN